jgi:hypothetical protein
VVSPDETAQRVASAATARFRAATSTKGESLLSASGLLRRGLDSNLAAYPRSTAAGIGVRWRAVFACVGLPKPRWRSIRRGYCAWATCCGQIAAPSPRANRHLAPWEFPDLNRRPAEIRGLHRRGGRSTLQRGFYLRLSEHLLGRHLARMTLPCHSTCSISPPEGTRT